MSVIKGTAFEVEVEMRLRSLNTKGFVTIPNLRVYSHTLQRETEIDRLLICAWGLYCLEMKAFNTELEGRFSDDNWIGRSGRYEHRLYNPVFQNFEHIRSLNNTFRRLGGKALKIENVVVVPDSCTIKSDTNLAMTLSELVDKVLIDSRTKPTIDLKQVSRNLSLLKAV